MNTQTIPKHRKLGFGSLMMTVSEPRYGNGITWRISTFADNTELAVLELPFRF